MGKQCNGIDKTKINRTNHQPRKSNDGANSDTTNKPSSPNKHPSLVSCNRV